MWVTCQKRLHRRRIDAVKPLENAQKQRKNKGGNVQIPLTFLVFCGIIYTHGLSTMLFAYAVVEV